MRLGVIRADFGAGSTRLLQEIARSCSRRRSLYVCTAGAEPLGALRYAFDRSLAMHGAPAEGALTDALARGLSDLLAGDGIDDDLGAELVAQWLALPVDEDEERSTLPDGESGPPCGVVLVDDSIDVDDPSLDILAKAFALDRGVRLAVHVEADGEVPPSFSGLAIGCDVRLGRLDAQSAAELALQVSAVPLDAEQAAALAMRGGFLPLGIVEAAALARATEGASLADEGEVDAAEWIRRRYDQLDGEAREVVRAVAVLGLDVPIARTHEMLEACGVHSALRALDTLDREGWLRVGPGFCGFVSRTHRAVVFEDIVDDDATRLHEAASLVVERRGGKLAGAEAARQAALAGNHPRSVQLALEAAMISRVLGLDNASSALLAFVGGNPEGFAALPTPTTVFRLESWIEALRASGEHDGAASRLEAIALLARGETGAALSALREGVADASRATPAAQSRAALAYAIGLAVAGEQSEALFAALDALARARESGEPRGERACARFLTRLSMAAGQAAAADTWQRLAGEPTIPPASIPPASR